MDNPIDYSAEVARINELTCDTERADAYASLASRLREERDKLLAEKQKAIGQAWLEPWSIADCGMVDGTHNHNRYYVLEDGKEVVSVMQFDEATAKEICRIREKCIAEHAMYMQPHYESTERIISLEDLLKEAKWTDPLPEQHPFDRGYNVAMMQVDRALKGEQTGIMEDGRPNAAS